MTDKTFYHQNVFAAFENGCELDLRVRVALDLIKSPAADVMYRAVLSVDPLAPVTAGDIAEYALDLAAEVLAHANDRGWVHALPDHNELSSPMRKHIERNVRAQVHQQQCVDRIMKDEAPQV